MGRRSFIDSIPPRPGRSLLPLWALVGLALLAAGVSVAAFPAGGFAGKPKISAMRAVADAHVSASSQNVNYGRQRTLTVDARPLTRAYLRFDINLKERNFSRVNLMLYSKSRLRLGYQVRLVTEKWRERHITYGNAPRISSRFVSSGPLLANAWKAVDITALVGITDHRVNLALTTVAPAGVTFASRESGLNGPRLVVEWNDDGKSTNPTTEPPPVIP